MTTRDAVLAALRAAGSGVVSGEELAARLGVSRVAVGKHIAALRHHGYEIEASAGSGYRLLAAPDEPLPSEVRPLLRSSFWARLEGGGPTGSTNDDAKALARSGAEEGTVVLASAQTAGRGRLGREWVSPRGGLYLSMVLRPDVAPVDVSSLALAVALGVARGLSGMGVRVALKWPNDVWLDGAKLAGILLEMSAEADRIDWIVAGVGINVNRSAETPPEAAVVSDVAGARVAVVAAAVLDGVAAAYRDWLRGGFSAMHAEYDRVAALTGRPVTVRDAGGRILADGIASGVDDSGRLLVESAGLTATVSAGDVTLR